MSNAEEVFFDGDWVLTKKLPALLWLWRDFWNWELFGRGEHQSGQTKRCRLACKAFYLIKHDRELRGEE